MLQVPEVIKDGVSAWAQYTIEVADRDGLAVALKDAGVPTAVYYPVPMHMQAVYAATMAGIDDGLTFAEALRADPTLAALLDGETDEKLERLLDPRSALGATGELVDRVLAAAAVREGLR